MKALILALMVAELGRSALMPDGFRPKDGFVPDAETAIKIAIAVWEPIYGRREIEGQKPFRASLRNGVWFVNGSLPPDAVGGVAEAEIAKKDGRVLRVYHGE